MDIECLEQIGQDKQDLFYKSGHFFGEMGLW